MRQLRFWLSLLPWERVVLLRLVFLLAMVWLGLRTVGFVRVRRWAEPHTPRTVGRRLPVVSEMDTMRVAQRCAVLANIAARRGLYQANCLHQALALCRMLRGLAIPSRLVVGVKKDGYALDAHAWTELEGVVLGSLSPGYHAFNTFGSDEPVDG